MIVPGKTQLAIGLILALTSASTMGSEPNQPAIELEFQISRSLRQQRSLKICRLVQKDMLFLPCIAHLMSIILKFLKKCLMC